jgi:hypothetical protein
MTTSIETRAILPTFWYFVCARDGAIGALSKRVSRAQRTTERSEVLHRIRETNPIFA